MRACLCEVVAQCERTHDTPRALYTGSAPRSTQGRKKAQWQTLKQMETITELFGGRSGDPKPKKYPFNFLTVSPYTSFRFQKGKEIFRVAAREVSSAPRGAIRITTYPQCVHRGTKPRALLAFFEVSSSAGQYFFTPHQFLEVSIYIYYKTKTPLRVFSECMCFGAGKRHLLIELHTRLTSLANIP